MEQAWILDLQTSRAVRISGETFRIGREEKDVDYCMAGDTVSRVHCDIFCKEGVWYVRDNNSTNRTFWEGRAIPRQAAPELKSGDILTIGEYRLMFLLREGEVW